MDLWGAASAYVALGHKALCNELELALLKRQVEEDKKEAQSQYQLAVQLKHRLAVVLKRSEATCMACDTSEIRVVYTQAKLLWIEGARRCDLLQTRIEELDKLHNVIVLTKSMGIDTTELVARSKSSQTL